MWSVYDKTGTIKRCVVEGLSYNGTFMGESYVSFNFNSPFPVSFEVGDYLEYRGERFVLNYTPSAVKNSNSMETGNAFEYRDVKMNSIADELTRCDFLDVVLADNHVHFTSLSKFSFYAATVKDLADRIQANLNRLYNGDEAWTVTVEEDVAVKDKSLSVDNINCWEALSLVNSDFDANFVISGRTIRIGTAGISVGTVFGYGKGNGLINIEQSTNNDSLIVTRLRAYGSTRNIPYRYYNNLKDSNGTPLIPESMYVNTLMLPGFAENGGDAYVDSPNITRIGIREKSVYFDGSGGLPEIYPSIEGMTAEELKAAGINVNATGRIDEIVSAEQMTDDGIVPEDKEELDKKTFTITLKDIGFNPVDKKHLTTETPFISMKTGMCGGREFEITGCEEKGNNYILTCNREMDSSINKAFPNNPYQVSAGDQFVFIGIAMDDIYIKAAEQRLLTAAKDYLSNNDKSKYTYLPKIDKVFMARHPEIASSLKEGNILDFKDTDLGIDVSVIIQSLVIKEGGPVPEYEITLFNDKVVSTIEKIQNSITSLASNIGITIEQAKSLFATWVEAWRVKWFDQKLRTFDPVQFNSVTSTDFESKLKGWVIDALGNAEFRDVLLRSFKSWNFAAGPLGAGVGMVNDDELQTDKLLVRKIMYVLEMMIQRMRFQGGIMVLSPATGFKIDRVETFDTYYRVYCRPEDFNEFEVNDQARIQNFTGNNIKYLWSLVLSRGDDYIDISRVDKDGDGVPAEGDEIVQLGNRTNPDRQDAVLLSAVNGEVGIFTYYGINNFDLSSKEGSWLGKHGGKKGAVIRGEVHITAGSSGLEQFDEYEDVDKRIQDAKDLADSVQDVVNNLTSIIIPDIQGQIDGSIMSHEGKVPPTLTNEPAVNWTTEEEKNRHLGDYYDYFLTVDGEQVTERYKFSKVNGAYQWVRVADSGSALAASVAREALGLAGTKATITWGNTLPEAPYNINDMWIKLDGSMYICNHQRLDGETGSQSDWQLFNDTMLRLAKMADDNVITKEEKATLRDTWNQIQKEFTAYQAQATKYGVSITALQNAYNTLNTFLTNTVKLSRDDEDTNLSVAQKTEYNQDFANYYSERTAFANVIAQKVADDSVGNLQIGGINLADYSGGDFLDVLGLYSGDRQYASKTTIDGKACLQYNDGSKNMRFAPVKVENAIYTFSIWVKGSEEYDAQVFHYNGSNYGSTTVHVTTSWERKVITFTAKAGSDIIHFRTKNTIYITDWKYEKGNKATDWSPSIADQNRLSREIAKAEAELAETKANAYADGIVTEAEQNAINEAQARLDALKIGSVNLVSRKMMLAWNEKNKDIAVWGQDSDGIYLAINQGLLYTNVSGGTSRLDCFLGEGKYKANTQYVFQVKWKLAGEQTNNNSGVSFWALYTDGTTDGIRLGPLQTSLIVESLITKKGKTVEKIFSSYGDNVYRSLIYSLALYEGNKVLAEPPVATEDITGQSNVNLLDNSKFQFGTEGYSPNQQATLNVVDGVLQVRSSKTSSTPGVQFPVVHLHPGVYTIKMRAKGINISSCHCYVYKDGTSDRVGVDGISISPVFSGISFTFAVSIEHDYKIYWMWSASTAASYPAGIDIEYSMLTAGEIAPQDWNPSPGDVAKDIKDVSDAVSSLQNFTDQAFADGIITRSEAQAIASNINVLNAEKADIDAYYTKLYANAYLTGTAKTNLASAKTAYNTAHTKLIDSINTAIADGKTTATEKADVDAKFTAYNNALSAYQTRVGEADKAIQDQIKALAEQDATNKVDGIQIGGENLLLNGDLRYYTDGWNPGWNVQLNGNLKLTRGWDNGYNRDVSEPSKGYHSHLDIKTFGFPVMAFINRNSEFGLANRWLGNNQAFSESTRQKLLPGRKYVISFELYSDTLNGRINGGFYHYLKGGNSQNFHSGQFNVCADEVGTWKRYSATMVLRADTDLSKSIKFYLYGNSDATDCSKYVRNISLQLGTKGDFSRAPEDVEYDIQESIAKTVDITAPSQVFKYGPGYTGTPAPSSIVLTATPRNFTPTSYQWQFLNGSTWINITIDGASSTYSVNPNSTTLFPSGTNVRTFRCICNGDEKLSDSFTLAKLADGATGQPGADGKDAYTILLGNESHAFAGSTAAALAGSTTCSVVAYKGATRVAATIGTISGLPTGMTASVASNGTTEPVITFTVTTSMTTASGTVNIPVTVDGKTFTKVFSYSIAFRGDPGESINGKMLYKDPEFKKGLNNVYKYTNSSNVDPDYIASKLTVERVTKPSDAPTQSGYCLKITCKAAQSPGYGGVYQSITSRANAVFVQKIIAKIPVGYKINTASNSMGTGYTDTWLTPTEGTGKYTTYLRKVVCGATGTFSVGGHVYITGNPAPSESVPLEWYIAYMTAFDLTADGYGDIEFSAKDDLAQQLGYSNFDKMVENASKGETIIKGAYINTQLIDVETLVADTALVDKLIGRELNFTLGSVGGFKMESTLLYSGAKFGTGGAGIAMQSMTNNYGFNVYKDNNNYVEMFQRSSEWGLKGVVNGSPVFQFGSTNKIGPFSYTGNLLVADNPYMLENGYKYDGGLVLSPNHIYFKYAMGSIYQQSVYIGVKGEHGSSSYGDNTVLGVEGGDIWHQAGDFYASNIRLRGDMDVYNNSIIRMKGQIHFDNVVTYTGSGAVTITADSGHFIYLTPITGNPVVSVSSGLPIGSWFIIAHATTAGGFYYIKLSGSDRFRRRGNAYQQVNSNNQDPSLIFKVNNTTWIIGNLPVNWIDWN